jgi:hypothetical protein
LILVRADNQKSGQQAHTPGTLFLTNHRFRPVRTSAVVGVKRAQFNQLIFIGNIFPIYLSIKNALRKECS